MAFGRGPSGDQAAAPVASPDHDDATQKSAPDTLSMEKPAVIPTDIGAWLGSLDGGSLVAYENVLRTLFDDVCQIRELYRDRLQDFFEDVSVQDPNHRLAFASALRALR